MDNQSFYEHEVPTVNNLIDLTDSSVFVPIPEDWWVVVADVKNSTEAIESGLYKEVNGIGAACIAAIVNACSPVSVPYVFGGDGASFCIPDSLISKCRVSLSAVRAMAREAFGLDLRVAAIPVSEIRSHNRDVNVVKLRVSEGYGQACFIGGGLDYAESLVKHPIEGASFSIGEYPGAEADYTGFECRWDEVPSTKDEIVALLVKARGDSSSDVMEIYRKVFTAIQSIYGENPDDNPMVISKMRTSLSPKKLSVEGRIIGFHDGKKKKTQEVWFKSFVGRIWAALDTTSWGVTWNEYKEIVRQNSDYRKLDDMFRTILSGSKEQTAQLIEKMEVMKASGEIVYGYHLSPTALITCLVFERNIKHSHLIDGSQGGYAIAAKMLKNQLA